MYGLRQINQVCSTCSTTVGMFTCRGCLKTFCLTHANAHRNSLEKQIDGIYFDCGNLKQHITSQETDDCIHRLLDRVNRWEEDSIEKIHGVANEIRQQLNTISQKYLDNTIYQLNQLQSRLRNARDNGNYFEDDLKIWKNVIQKLKWNLSELENIKIYEVQQPKQFISKIGLTINVKDYGMESVKLLKYNESDMSTECTNLSLTGVYASGNRLFRFKIDATAKNTVALMGVISSITAAYEDPYENSTFYGWSTDNRVYLHGSPQLNFDNYHSDIQVDDIFHLILNCDRHMIRLVNERTNQIYQLNVDITKCPLPWQPHVRLLSSL